MLHPDWKQQEQDVLKSAATRAIASPTYAGSPKKELHFRTDDDPSPVAMPRQPGAIQKSRSRGKQSLDWRPKGALAAVAGEEGWQWCRLKGSLMSASDLAPPRAPPGAPELGRSLTSPSMLTEEGQREATRVLGATPPEFMPGPTMAASRDGSRPSSAAQRAAAEAASNYRVPQTCNQIYGSRNATAEKAPLSKWGKNSCDVCLFKDAMDKTKTPYNASIRF